MSEVNRVWYACDWCWKKVSFYEFSASGETDKFLISSSNGRREAKKSEYRRWFQTKREALDDLVERQRKVVADNREALRVAVDRLALMINTEVQEESQK